MQGVALQTCSPLSPPSRTVAPGGSLSTRRVASRAGSAVVVARTGTAVALCGGGTAAGAETSAVRAEATAASAGWGRVFHHTPNAAAAARSPTSASGALLRFGGGAIDAAAAASCAACASLIGVGWDELPRATKTCGPEPDASATAAFSPVRVNDRFGAPVFIAATSSSIEPKRSAGFLARQRATIASTSSVTSADGLTSRIRGGASFTCAMSVLTEVLRSKGTCPASISNRRTPSA